MFYGNRDEIGATGAVSYPGTGNPEEGGHLPTTPDPTHDPDKGQRLPENDPDPDPTGRPTPIDDPLPLDDEGGVERYRVLSALAMLPVYAGSLPGGLLNFSCRAKTATRSQVAASVNLTYF